MDCSLPRLLCPRDFPGKSTGVGCDCLLHEFSLQISKCFNFKIYFFIYGPLHTSTRAIPCPIQTPSYFLNHWNNLPVVFTSRHHHLKSLVHILAFVNTGKQKSVHVSFLHKSVLCLSSALVMKFTFHCWSFKRVQTWVSCPAGRFFTFWATRRAPIKWKEFIVNKSMLHFFMESRESVGGKISNHYIPVWWVCLWRHPFMLLRVSGEIAKSDWESGRIIGGGNAGTEFYKTSRMVKNRWIIGKQHTIFGIW